MNGGGNSFTLSQKVKKERFNLQQEEEEEEECVCAREEYK